MNNLLRYPVLMLAMLVFAACGTSGGGTNVTVSDTGNVEGKVTDTITGNLLAGVTVQIGNQTVTSGTNGVYTISNLSVGSRTITAALTGYQGYNGEVSIQKGTTIKHDITMSAPVAKTTATLKMNLTGTLPASTGISGAGFTLTLPTDVTPALTSGVVSNGVATPSGTFAGGTQTPPIYTAATASTPGTLKVTLANSIPAGVTQVGEVATITLQLANGAAPTTGSFGVSAVSVVDAVLYNSISGMGAEVAGLSLQ